MASGPKNPRRTPKVAGRASSRVELSNAAAAKRAAAQEADAAVASTGAKSAKVTETTAPAGESGVARKRERAQAARDSEAAAAKRAAVSPTPGDTRATYRFAAILAGIAAVLAVAAGVLAFHPGAKVSDNKAFVDTAETDKVLAQTRDAVCAPFQYDYRELDKWQERVDGLLGGKALAEFQTFIKASRETITQSKSSSDCRVDAVGLADLSADSATVIANLVVSTNQDGAITDSAYPQVRMVMRRDGDRWVAAEVLQP